MEEQPICKITTFSDCWHQMMELQDRMEEEFRRDIIDYCKTNILKVKVKSTRKKKVVSKPVVQILLTPVEEEVELDNGVVVSASSSRCSKRTVAKKAQEKISFQLRQTLNEKLRNPEITNKKTKTLSSNESTGRMTNASDVSVVSAKEKDCKTDEVLPSCFVLLDRLPEPKKDDQTKENNSNSSTVDLFGLPSASEKELIKSDCVPDTSTVFVPDNDTVPYNDTVPNNNTELNNESVPVFSIVCSTITTTTITEDKNTTQPDHHFVIPAPIAVPDRPSRVRTKNKKYTSELFMTNIAPNKSVSVSKIGAVESMNKSTNSRKGKKRKSDEEIDASTKHVKLSKVVKTSVLEANETENKTETDSTFHSDVANSIKDKAGSCEENESTSKEIRTRTRVLNKPFNSNMVVVEPEEQEAKCDEQPVAEIRVVPPPESPVRRMTRTRTKELNTNQAQVDQSTTKAIAMKVAAEIKCGKENKIGHVSKMMKSDKGHKISPLSSSNFLFSPSAPISLSKVTPMKVDSAYKKVDGSATKALVDSVSKLLPREAIALEKRNELIKAKTEEVKRKREEKEKRVLVSKKAVEQATMMKFAKIQKDREEKERLLAESKRVKEEQLLKKKQITEAMNKEAEERRLKEEEAKKARLLKQEEEKKKQAELRLKMAQDAKKLQELRMAQEAVENEARLIAAEKKAKQKQKAQVEVVSYELTPSKDASDYVPKPLKNEDDYGLSDDSGASTDDEKQPKKVIPKWAAKHYRSKQVIVQDKVSSNLVNSFFPPISKDSVELTNMKCHRPRASSAVWNTPGKSN